MNPKRLFATSAMLILLTSGCSSVSAGPQWSFPPQASAAAAPGATAATAAADPTPAASAAAAATPAASSDAGMAMTTSSTGSASAAASGNAPAYTLRDPKAPAVMPGTVHDVDLPIVEKDMTVATGHVVHVWTFGGEVPGPVIRVHLGDTVRVHLTNTTPMPHSIDFHASQTSMDHNMMEIPSGGTFTYTFQAAYAGVWMYHCGTQPALLHIANGMFGMVIVEPRGGLDKVLGPVDQEFAFVQNEWYLGADGQPVDYTKANSTAPQPDFVAFNGVASQYADNPITVKAGGRVRIFVLDAGPNIGTSFHVVGTIFDTVEKEGMLLSKGNAAGWGAQAVDLAPAQAAIIQFTPAEPGKYAFVDHAFDMVTHGAVGYFQAK